MRIVGVIVLAAVATAIAPQEWRQASRDSQVSTSQTTRHAAPTATPVQSSLADERPVRATPARTAMIARRRPLRNSPATPIASGQANQPGRGSSGHNPTSVAKTTAWRANDARRLTRSTWLASSQNRVPDGAVENTARRLSQGMNVTRLMRRVDQYMGSSRERWCWKRPLKA